MQDWKKAAEEGRKRRQEEKAKAVAKLKELGVELHIGACGCCDSPWVTLKVNGETLVDNADSFNLEERDYQAS